MQFQILGSSSSGNASLIRTPECSILLDAGFSGKRLKELLKTQNVNIENIDAVFLTHEHQDHCLGLRGLSKYSHLKLFANRETAHILQKKLAKPVYWHLFETGSIFNFRDLEVTTFSIPHDAQDPVGYVFRYLGSQSYSIAWVTDLGYIPKLVQEKIRHVDVLVIECNYDTAMLDNDPNRPWSLKQRIKGRHGHLSNELTYEFISQSQDVRWKHVYLAHLSRECNNIERLADLFTPLLKNNRPFKIEIVDPHKHCVNKFFLV